MIVRAEEARDRTAVGAVNAAAFARAAEARLVDALRRQAQPVVSLVAERDAVIVGHIMFSPVRLPDFPDCMIMGLGPMAVIPEHQRVGIGSALVRAGLEQCRRRGIQAVVVLGHPEYYPRFGFAASAMFGIACEYKAPAGAFMVVELQPGSLRGTTGTVRYHPAFGDAL